AAAGDRGRGRRGRPRGTARPPRRPAHWDIPGRCCDTGRAMAEIDDTEPHLTIRADPTDPSAPVLHVAGELDLATAPKLSGAAKQAVDAGASSIVFDLAELGFMDSSGLRVLLEVAGQVDKVTVRNASDTA